MQTKNMLDMLELLLASQACYQRGPTHFHSRMTKSLICRKQSESWWDRSEMLCQEKTRMVGIFNFLCIVRDIKIIEVPTTSMQHHMKITLLILQRDHAEELIKKRVYDSQVSKKLLKQILLKRHAHQISCKQSNWLGHWLVELIWI